MCEWRRRRDRANSYAHTYAHTYPDANTGAYAYTDADADANTNTTARQFLGLGCDRAQYDGEDKRIFSAVELHSEHNDRKVYQRIRSKPLRFRRELHRKLQWRERPYGRDRYYGIRHKFQLRCRKWRLCGPELLVKCGRLY